MKQGVLSPAEEHNYSLPTQHKDKKINEMSKTNSSDWFWENSVRYKRIQKKID